MIRFFLFLGVLINLVACGGTEPAGNDSSLIVNNETASATNQATANEQYTIALVMKTLTNPFFVEMEKGARQAEAELGIHLLVKTGAQETSVEQQITIVENLITDKVSAIVIAPADSIALIPVLKKAQDAGIVIVNIDNQLDPVTAVAMGLTNVPYISVDNLQGGYLSAKYLSDQITTPTEAIILEGIRSAQNAQDRRDGAMKAFAENSNITLVAQETANWKIDEAYQVTADLFKEHPNIGAIFCANDMMAFGAIQYLQETGKTDVRVVSYDALDEAKTAIKEGTLLATIDQQAALQGYTGITTALKMLKGESVPPSLLVDVMLVTKDNVDQ